MDSDDEHQMGCKSLPNSFHSSELNKKRKLLQYELGNSGLPWPKQKVRDLSRNLGKENRTEKLTDCTIGDGSEIESENDSNSISGGSVNKMTFEMNVDEQPSASSCNSSSVSQVSKGTLYSLESRSMKVVDERVCVDEDEQCTGVGPNADDLELEHETSDETMLYSNDMPPFLLSSGRWGLGKDARLGTRKPTIDQEFEQYFSSLML